MNDPYPSVYPVHLQLTGRRCVVVGGGQVGWRRAKGLLEADASVVVISPQAEEELAAAAAQGKLVWEQREYRDGDLQGAALAFAAAGDTQVNAAVAAAAKRLGTPVSVADDAAACDFYVPSVIRRGRLTISVSTGGASPKLTKRIARELSVLYGQEYEAYTELLSRMRTRLKEEVPLLAKRNACLERLLDMDLLSKLREGASVDEAERAVWAELACE